MKPAQSLAATAVVFAFGSFVIGQGPALIEVPERSVRASLGGAASAFAIDSTHLAERRVVSVIAPASLERSGPERRYPLVFVLDGESLLAPVAAATAGLVAAGQMPEVVLVGVENTSRLRDLTPPGISVSGSSRNEGGDRFLDFLESELAPALERQFRAGALRVLVGHSSGGILATYAAATRAPFRFVLALDTPAHLDNGWLGERLIERTRRSSEPHLRYVSYNARFGWPTNTWARVQAAAPQSWRLFEEKLTDETHESMTLLGAYLGLRRLFDDYASRSAPTAPASSTLAHYDSLQEEYGMPVPPPRPLLRQVMDDLLMTTQGAAARSAFDLYRQAYGPPADAEELAGRIAEAEKAPAPAETIEGLLAEPMPDAAAIAPFLGEWSGESWMNPESKNPVVLRIRAVDGVVSAEWIMFPAAGVELPQKIQHLKITADGLSFGYLNGMRPRGVLLYEARRAGDQLEGRMRLAGMTFTMPDGRPLPPIYFTLRRVPRV